MGLHDLPVNRFRDIERLAVGICSEGAGRIADDMRESALAHNMEPRIDDDKDPLPTKYSNGTKVLVDILGITRLRIPQKRDERF